MAQKQREKELTASEIEQREGLERCLCVCAELKKEEENRIDYSIDLVTSDRG